MKRKKRKLNLLDELVAAADAHAGLCLVHRAELISRVDLVFCNWEDAGDASALNFIQVKGGLPREDQSFAAAWVEDLEAAERFLSAPAFLSRGQ